MTATHLRRKLPWRDPPGVDGRGILSTRILISAEQACKGGYPPDHAPRTRARRHLSIWAVL